MQESGFRMMPDYFISHNLFLDELKIFIAYL